MGLVETSVGLIPAAGGCKELLRRWTSGLPSDADPLPYLKEAFETIALAKVSSSAAEALDRRLLRPGDPVTMNRDRLLEDARQTALAMARLDYHPDPSPPQVWAAGRSGFAALKLGIHLTKQAGYISAHDARIGTHLAYVLSGGDLAEPALVPESYLLGLEREAFLSLCGEPKTQERMDSILKTGKPLRN
jgi:3-hydroxyacyl-CoA dehydrogenase